MPDLLSPRSFLGESDEGYADRDLYLTESRYPKGTSLPEHAHESAFFYLVLEGGCIETLYARDRTLGPATLFFHPAHEPHANYWPEGGSCFHIEFTGHCLGQIPHDTPLIDRPSDHGGFPVWLASRMYREFRHRDALSSLILQGLALELLAETSRNGGPRNEVNRPRWLDEARDILNDRVAENWGLKELGQLVGIDPSHLARAFRKSFGMSVGEYVRKLRLDLSCRLMISSDKSLSEIAIEAGFADQSHFTKTFKAYLGLKPSEFRDRI